MLYAKLAGLVLLSLLRLKEMEAEVQYGIRYRDPEAERSVHQMKAKGGTRVIHRSSRREPEGMTSVRGEVDNPRSLFDYSFCGKGKACKSASSKFGREKLGERRHTDTAIDDDYFIEPTLTHARATSQAAGVVHPREVDYGPGDDNLAEPPFPLTGDDIVPPPDSPPSAAPTRLSSSPHSTFTITIDTAVTTSAPSRLSSPPPSISTIAIDATVRTSSSSSESVSLDKLTNRGNDEDETTPSNDDPSIVYDDADSSIRSHERSPSNDPFDDDFV